jgi:hypothetical protein
LAPVEPVDDVPVDDAPVDDAPASDPDAGVVPPDPAPEVASDEVPEVVDELDDPERLSFL